MLGSELFTITDKLAKSLQATTLSAAEGKSMAMAVVKVLQGLRSKGDDFFNKVISKSAELGNAKEMSEVFLVVFFVIIMFLMLLPSFIIVSCFPKLCLF